MAIRKRGNSYQVVYRCPGEMTVRTETFHSEDEALIRDMQIKLAKKKGAFTPPEKITKASIQYKENIITVTVEEFLKEYVEAYGLKMWGNSFYSLSLGLIKNYINPYLGSRRVSELTVRDIDAYYTELMDKPAVIQPGRMDTGAKVTAHTVDRVHKLLKSAFNKAVVWQYTAVNPTIGATLPTARSAQREAWSDEEAIQALNLCDTEPLGVCLYLALGCSMRLGEILGLQWSNVHIDDGLVSKGEAYLRVDRELNRCSNQSIEALERVNRSTILFKFPKVMPKKASTTLVLKAPKTESSNRTIYLPSAVIEELKKIRIQQAEYKRLLGQEYHDYGLVVAQINGHPYEHRVIDKQFAKLIEKNRLRPVVFHSLRHSSTSLKLKLSRGNIKAVQGDTGHAEARMVTDTYAHGFDADRKLIAHEMDIGFFAKVGNSTEENSVSPDTIQQLRSLIQSHPELMAELLKGTDGSAEGTGNTA